MIITAPSGKIKMGILGYIGLFFIAKAFAKLVYYILVEADK